jgi:predicted O-methyltransferase YrrM
MDRIVLPNVESYMHMLLPQRDHVLTEIEKLASNNKIPIVGPAVGRFLFLLARLVGAQHVFEMGSAVGYSTIWLARAVGENGTVYFTDTGEENVRQARIYLKKAGVSKQVKLLIGDAVQLIDTVEGNFDLIFIDLAKKQYPEAFAKAYPRLRHGGILVTDNVLLFGLVANINIKDTTIEAVREFNRLLYSKDDLFTTILPIRDGVSVSLRL